jgi:uncharacterized paraquat-inducible protein A
MEFRMSRPKVLRSMWRLMEKVGLSRAGARPDKSDPLVTRCPHCEQKLRYAPKRSGKEAQCPRCKQRFDLPRRPSAVVRPVPHAKVGYSVLRERI